MSPILVRPVREQLEHDRVIRLLQGKLRRRFEVGINPGTEQNVPAGTAGAVYPDLVLLSLERGHRLQGVIEVETGESVNHLEALAQWAHFARLRVPLHLYVPSGMVDVARRLCEDNQIHVQEIWSFHLVGDEFRFTLVHKGRESGAESSRSRGARPPASARPSVSARPPASARPSSPARPPASARPPAAARRKTAAVAKRAARSAKPTRGKAPKKAARTQKRK